MELWERLSHQRVQYIIESYQLYGDTKDDFDSYVKDLLLLYPSAQIELALVETLIESWAQMPLVKGMVFITKAHTKLKSWHESKAIAIKITPAQFKQITNLDPTPVFGNNSPVRLRHKSHY